MKIKYGYFGHHKTGSQWFWAVISAACRDLNIKLLYYALDGDHESKSKDGLDFVCDVNAELWRYENSMPRRSIHVVRDPRDMIVSGYYSHLNSHPTDRWPELDGYRQELQNLDLSDGLIREISFSSQFIKPIQDWNYNQEGVLELKFESVTTQQFECWFQIFQHLGLFEDERLVGSDEAIRNLKVVMNQCSRKVFNRSICSATKVDPLTLMNAVYINDFKFKSQGRGKGIVDNSSHYRKGTSGDWKSHFNRRHGELFLEQYGDLLIRLSYEENSDWVHKLPVN